MLICYVVIYDSVFDLFFLDFENFGVWGLCLSELFMLFDVLVNFDVFVVYGGKLLLVYGFVDVLVSICGLEEYY